MADDKLTVSVQVTTDELETFLKAGGYLGIKSKSGVVRALALQRANQLIKEQEKESQSST